jgi:sugar/nucleoside kinase (ribokinase family)
MMSKDARYDILGLGIATIDDLVYVAHYPPPNTKSPALRRERQCGGLTMTAFVAAVRLGARCAYAGQLGDDDDSRTVLAAMQHESIDTSHVVHVAEARPVISTIIVGENGTRNIFPWHPDIEGAHPTLPPELVIRNCKVLFVDHVGIDGHLRAAHIAREAGIPIVSDIENDQHPRTPALLALVDHLIASEDFAVQLTHTHDPAEAVRRLSTPGRALVAVTCGTQGCWFAVDGDSDVQHQPAFAVDAIDTTGCGDVFHGAYAAALAQGMPATQRIRFASAAAALKATQRGGQAGAPSRTAVEQFLNVHV